MSDDPLAGLRAWMQEAETRFEDIEETLCNQEKVLMSLRTPSPGEVQRAARGLLDHGLEDISKTLRNEDDVSLEGCHCSKCENIGVDGKENRMLDQIQRMAKSLATMQEQLVKVAIERDDWKRQYEISAHLVSGPQI